MNDHPNDLPSFLVSRLEWLRVETVDRPGGGWDVVIVIDGTYFGERFASKKEMVAYYAEWIADELDPQKGAA